MDGSHPLSSIEPAQPASQQAVVISIASQVTDQPAPHESAAEPPEVGSRYIWLMVVAQFGVFTAFITPLAISLSIRVEQLAPEREEYLGYITGAGAFAVMLTGPFLGIASDRTRTRIGRRRPFMIAGTLLGVVSLLVMALAPGILALGAGWVMAQLTWGQAYGNLLNSTADRLPASQRGKVAGLTGLATQVAPVFGVVIAGGLASRNVLLFLVPGLVGVVAVALFVVGVHEPDSRQLAFGEQLTWRRLLSKYVFDPRRHPDYSWNWLGRFFFYFGLTLNTTFAAFFFAARLGVTVDKVAGVVAVIGGLGVAATTAGAVGGGFLSDRLQRRRAFVLAGGAVFGAGAVVMALAPNLPVLVAGSVLTSLGTGTFAAVDQALLLDVLPERETDAGRFMGIMGFAISMPQAFAPLIAPAFLAIGAGGGEKNYALLYTVAAACTVAGGLVVLRIRSVR